MDFIAYGSLGMLFVALFFQCVGYFQGHEKQRKKLLALFSVAGLVFILFYYFYLVYAQYGAWKQAGPPASFLVPPYRGIEYVFFYHFIRFLLYYVVSFLVASGIFLLMRRHNKIFDGRFFENDEPYIAALSIFILGYGPWNYLWIFYLCAIVYVSMLVSVFRKSVRRGEDRFSLYFLWLPFAIVGIIIAELLL